VLRRRRAGRVEARRGRLGGYRLARPAGQISVAEVLSAVGAQLELQPAELNGERRAEHQVLITMESRLQRAMERELSQFNLEELLYDLQSTRESLSQEGGLMLG
jgi:DNA-binding IscR family transcriptional regulator